MVTSMASLRTPAERAITQLYIGYFDRAADRAGFDFWLAQANSGAAILDIAYSFSQSEEYQSIYGGLGNQALINMIYGNLFHRAPDPEGNAYWLNELANGKPSARLIVDVISGAQGNDRLILENAAIVAKDWTDRSPAAFDIVAAHEAIDSINASQPFAGDTGLAVNITSLELLPFQNQINAAMKAAWWQWEVHFANQSQIQIDVGYFPLPDTGKIASAAPRMEVVTASGYTQSGVAQEIITGMDPNGNMADGFINLHMAPSELFSRFDMTTVFAHEIGHFFFRTQINNSNAEHITNYDSFISSSGGTLSFNGPNAMGVYGGPIPVSKMGAFNDYAHFDDWTLLMDPYYDALQTVGVVDLAVLNDLGIGVV